MKIGILTFHRSVNNGAVMQCYSLSKRLQKDFPDADIEVVDYHMPKVSEMYSSSLTTYLKSNSLKAFAKKVCKLVMQPTLLLTAKKRNAMFDKAIVKLPLSPDTIYENGMDSVFRYINNRYDALIVGSDAVWNFVVRGFPNAYFPDSRVVCPKLSYAASCYGMCYENYEKNREIIGKVLDDFSFIGVRDEATESFVKWSGCNKNAVHTCDPTAFLDVDDLPIDTEELRQKLAERGFDFNRPTIGIMGKPQMVKMVRQFYGDKYQLVALFQYTKGADVQLFDLEPYEWAYVFRYFKLTFTTFFHGTMLSLRNGVPLICVALNTTFSKTHTPKTLDILKRLGFEDWYFKTDYKNVNTKEIKKKADELLASDLKSEIIDRLDKEALSFEQFEDELKKILNNKKY